MTRNVSVFCDGTWSDEDRVEPTNVALLSQMVLARHAGRVQTPPIYARGVGSGGVFDQITGGAFGWRLDEILEDTYRRLAAIYRPGDALFVFGFSRGAYMARSLVGLLRNCGLPRPGQGGQIRNAISYYRDRDKTSEPDAKASLEFRRAFSPRVATSAIDLAARPKAQRAQLLNLAYLGIWDTVGSLGIPSFAPGADAVNAKYQFHDTKLSSLVQSARHAVAIDERRDTFRPTLWKNVEDLNTEVGARRYLERWFPGEHGGVGGGGPERGLSSRTLVWIAEGAAEAGLGIDTVLLAREQAKIRPEAPVANAPRGSRLAHQLKAAFHFSDRDPPARFTDISEAAIERWKVSPLPPEWKRRPYRPGTLQKFSADLE